jgi:hypothetical protein
MKKLPRDLSSEDLCRALNPLGYEVTRPTILSEVAAHLRITRQELQERLFGV